MRPRHQKCWLSILLVGLAFTSCDRFLGEDTNVDPNRSPTASLPTLLAAGIEATSNNHYLIANTTGLFSQHLASYFVGGSDSHNEVRLGDGWTGIYLTALSNLDVLVEQATAQNAPHYAGIGKVLQAINLGLAADTWGDVPFAQAFGGTGTLRPAYDPQPAVYQTIQQLLDDALADLAQPTSALRPGTDDLVYGAVGNIPKWIKAAYALKARYGLHTSKKGPQGGNDALNAVSSAFASNGDDLQLVYNSVNKNPWHTNVALPINTGNFTVGPSQQLVDAMNGTTYPAVDPRLPLMFDRRGNTAPYAGTVNGAAVGGNTNVTANTYYAREAAPVLIITFAETKFIEAEAEFLANGGTRTSVGGTQRAYSAYLAGIRAHMDKVGVTAADRDAYLAHPTVGVGSAGLTLELIMKEKFVTTFLNPENWVDVRRYDYDPLIYKGMSLPANHNPALNGQFIRRVLYPTDELNRNAVEVNKVIAGLADRVWWDQ
ncbi:MAG: SusD/RagB family nutrient-binding outer membrane lipoprotein [Ferruginibacter sp.]|nr:SusD/RagB family nutrient-binding outer membrane lipoprotein [Cytophagales bacterium]